MKKLLIFALLLGLTGAEPGWDPGTAYTYTIYSQSLSTFDETENEYHGVIMNASLKLQTGTLQPASLIGKLEDVQYSEIHGVTPNECFLPNIESSLSWEKLNISNATFEVILDNGVVKALLLSSNVTTGEANIIRAVVSQLQIDLQGKNKIDSKLFSKYYLPDNITNQFSAMEKSINGYCETIYDITRLPKYAIRNKPTLAPILNASQDLNNIIDIVKISNFSNCKQHLVYHRGINNRKNWDAGMSSVRDVINRKAEARIIIEGSYENYTLHSSVITEKMLVSPSLYKKEKAIIIICLNLTLNDMRNADTFLSPFNQTETTLLYDYEYNSTENIDTGFSNNENRNPEMNNRVVRHILDKSESSYLLKYRQERDVFLSPDTNDNFNALSTTIPTDTTDSPNNSAISTTDHITTSISDTEASTLETSTSSTIIMTTDDTETVSNTTGQLSTTPDSITINENISVSPTYSLDNNSAENQTNINAHHISNALHLLNMSRSLEQPLLSSFFTIYPSVQNKSALYHKEIETAIKVISEQIANNILDFKSIADKSVLNTFCELTFLIANTEFEVLHNVTRSLYKSLQSNEKRQQLTWTVFRDAVTQAGTGPALMLIKEWIVFNMTTASEAADIIEQLSNTAEIPNEQYIDAFFEMIKHPCINMQEPLNVSAVLAFTNVVRQVFVDSYARKSLYPVHVFSPMVHNETKLKAVYLQYIQEQLESAIINEDKSKIHVYIRAMGNLAHPEIFNILNQYLRNNTKLTIFQKVLIVISLDKIAELYPVETQNFLLPTYMDENEPYEVRTAAVFQIMHTKPPVNILKRIAEHTQYDSSNQVISAVKSSILSAAELNDLEDEEFSKNAKSVMHLLNPKKLGIHYSSNIFKSYNLRQIGSLGYRNSISFIGSDNNIFPKAFFINYERDIGRLHSNREQYGIIFSDLKRISHILENIWNTSRNNPEINLQDKFPSKAEHYLHSENGNFNKQNASINEPGRNGSTEEYDINEDPHQPEAMFFFPYANAEKIVTFGENVTNIEKWLQQKMKNLKTGYKFNYNKLFHREKFLYAVPNVAGFITQVMYKVPTIYHLTGKMKVNITKVTILPKETLNTVQEVNFTGQFNFGYSFNKHTDIGFVTPFNGNRYVTGYKEQLLLNIPITIHTAFLSKGQWGKVVTTFSPSSNDSLGFYSQFNSQLYRQHDTISDIVKKQRVASTRIIQKQPQKQFIKEFGGLQLNISVNPNTNEFSSKKPDLLLFLDSWTKQKSVDNRNIILKANFPTTESSITFKMQYANFNNFAKEVLAPETTTQKPRTHRRSVKSTDNIKQYSVPLNKTFNAEWSVSFDHNKPIYMINFNYTWNDFANNTNFKASLYQKHKDRKCNNCHYDPMLTLKVDGVWANLPLFNFSKAISVNPESEINAVLLSGSSKTPIATIECDLQRSAERKMYVLEQQETKECLEEMKDGNLILPSCQLATQRASYLDKHQCKIEISSLNEESVMNISLLQSIRSLPYENFRYYSREHSDPSNNIFFFAQFAPDFDHVDVSTHYRTMGVKLKQIKIASLLRPTLQLHPSQSALARTGQDLLESQYYPTCVLDKDKVNTFDNKTYAVKLGTCWYVLMALTLEQSANPRLSENDILILARDNNEERVIRLLVGDDVIDIGSQTSNKNGVNKYIYVNTMQYHLFPDRYINVSLHRQNSNIELQSTIFDQKVKLQFVNISTQVVFDGTRVMVTTGNRFRNQTLGLCGTFNGEESDDFALPTQCNISDPQLFISSYAIVNNNTCSDNALQWANEATNKSCSVTSDIYLNSDFPSVASCSNNHEPDPRCMTSYVQVQQDYINTCFSKNSLPKCKPSCYPINLVKKNVRFHCVATSVVSTHFVDAIRSGKLHDFTTKKTTKSIAMDIPTGCYKCDR